MNIELNTDQIQLIKEALDFYKDFLFDNETDNTYSNKERKNASTKLELAQKLSFQLVRKNGD